MTVVRYVLVKVRPGVSLDEFEKFEREVDYVKAAQNPSIVSYRTHRIEGPINGAETAGWSYIERIEIRDVEQYQRDMASPAGQELIRQLYDNYLERPKNIFFWSEEITD